MALLLIFIFFALLMFNIMSQLINKIAKKIVDITQSESSEEIMLRKELKELAAVLNQTHVVNEFVKYARTERKINKITEDLKQRGRSKSNAVLKAKVVINAFIYAVQIILFLGLIYMFKSSPLIELPPDWFWPVANLLAFPTGIPGAVSITIWILACRSVVQRVTTLVGQ